MKGCPVEINIPGFIKAISEGDMAKSAEILKDKNNLPAVCGRVCPQESQCEARCIVGIKGEPVAIGRLERYVADWERENNTNKSEKKTNSPKEKVAIVGSGPAGCLLYTSRCV